MTIRILMLVLALLGGAGEAAAQRTSDRDRAEEARDGPVDLLLRSRDRLELSDEQVRRLTAIRVRMQEANRPLVARLLEIRREARGALGDRRDRGRREVLRQRAEAARPLLKRIRDNNRAAMREVGEALTDAQKRELRRMLRDPDSREDDDDGRRRRGRGR